MPSSVQFHRVLTAPAARVFRAFTDPQAMVKWLPPHGFTAKVHNIDARVGGTYKMSFTNFTTGSCHSFGGEYLEIDAPHKLVYIDRFDDPNLLGDMRITITLTPVSCGTELCITQEGIPDVIPAEMCCVGWQQSLVLLAQLVEPEILDAG